MLLDLPQCEQQDILPLYVSMVIYIHCVYLLSGCVNSGSLCSAGFHRDHRHYRHGDECVCLHLLEC